MVYVSDVCQGVSGVHAIEIGFDIGIDVSKAAQSNFRKYSILRTTVSSLLVCLLVKR